MRTNEDYIVENYKPVSGEIGYGMIIVPKGTRVTHQTACGVDKNYHFVDELGWIDEKYPEISHSLKHDMVYHSINVPKEFIEY